MSRFMVAYFVYWLLARLPKKMVRRAAQSGQASVLMALSMIGILGFAVLGIDGGKLYVTRRQLQNAADASAYASGWEYMHDRPFEAAGIASVQANKPGANSSFTLDPAPASLGLPGAVIITSDVDQTVPTFIGGFVGHPNLPVSAQAVVIIHPKRIQADTNGTVIATSKTCANTAQFTSGKVHVPMVISFFEILASTANGVFDQTFHLGSAQYSEQVSVGSDNQLYDVLPVYAPNPLDYFPGGKRAIQEQAKGDYVDYEGDLSINFHTSTGAEFNGKTVFVRGSVKTVGSPPDGFSWTLVATGPITFSADSVTIRAHIDNLLLATTYVATNCSDNGITFSTKKAIVVGGILAPNSGVSFSASLTKIFGWVLSLFSKFAASESELVSETDANPFKDRSMLLVK